MGGQRLMMGPTRGAASPPCPLLLILLCVWGSGYAGGSHAFRDYAKVLAVEPVIAQQAALSDPVHCHRGVLNRMWRTPMAATIGEDIGSQQRLRRTLGDCQGGAQRQRIEGYRVTYQYQGETGIRFMREDPGAFFPVRVVLSPER